jgi:hypothetical protein
MSIKKYFKYAKKMKKKKAEKYANNISELGHYHITLSLFCYIIRIMTLFLSIKTLLYQLLFCRRPDYYCPLLHYLQSDYYFTYDTSITSLIFLQ